MLPTGFEPVSSARKAEMIGRTTPPGQSVSPLVFRIVFKVIPFKPSFLLPYEIILYVCAGFFFPSSFCQHQRCVVVL